MAGNIKGITIEFRGETTKLESALRKVNQEARKIDSELRKVDKALKFNPKSVELWTQKQQLLKQRITETEDRLKLLKQQQASMDAAGVDKNSAEYRKLQREIIECESKLKQFKSQLAQIGQANLRAVGEQFKEVGGKIEEAGQKAQKFSAVAGAGLAASAKASLSYSDAIAKMSTISDDAQVPVSQLRKQLMDLSNQTGRSSTELAEAAYQALSASVETKDVVGFVSDASKLAKAGFLETSGAVDVLTTIINAYGYSAKDATMIADQLVQTQNDGKTTVNELAEAMGQVIPTASALNIPLEQLNAAYVALTKQGINTANSTTYLNGMFTELADNGSGVSEVLQEKTGKSFGQLMRDGASLGDILQILNDSVGGDSEQFLNLWGNVRAGRGALALLNNGVDEFNAEAEAMAGATGNVETALGKLNTPSAQARKALNMLVNAGIQLGDNLAPAIEKVALFVQGLVDKFNALSPQTKSFITTILAIVAAIAPVLMIGGKLISGIGTLLITLGKVIGFVSKLLPLIKLVFGIIGTGGAVFLGFAAVIGIAALAIYKHWDQIKAWAIALKDKVVQAVTQLKTNAVAQFEAMKAEVTAKWNALKQNASNLWNGIKATIVNIVNNIKANLAGAWNTIKTTAQTAWNNVKTAITTPISNAYNTVKGWISRLKNLFPLKVGKIFSNLKVPHIKVDGGKAPFGIGGKGSAPHISVDWYAQGGIFTRPTLLGANGRLAGVGEAGAEAVLPIEKLREMVDFGNAQGNAIIAQQTQILLAIYEEMQKEKDFKVNGMWAGRYVNELVR